MGEFIDYTAKGLDEPSEASRVARERAGLLLRAAESVLGECDYPSYCKFYGENPSFCDRSCSESVLDQI